MFSFENEDLTADDDDDDDARSQEGRSDSQTQQPKTRTWLFFTCHESDEFRCKI